MKKFSQKGLLLFGVMLAVSAFVMPAMASAASWSPVGTTHQLFSSNLSFTSHGGPLGHAGSSCAGSEFDADVTSAQVLTITSGRFSNCTGTGGAANCTVTPVQTGVWTATAIATTNIQIHNFNVDALFEGITCQANGAKALVTGTLTSGSWIPAGNEAVFTSATDLTIHFLGVGLSSTMTVSGTLRDTTGTLRMFD
jgi:hypothetical protein